MTIDIVIYAVITVIILARLWTVFGRRNDEDIARPNPFLPPAPATDDKKKSVASPALQSPFTLAPESLAGGLERLKQMDAAFDEKQFLQAMKQSFTLVVENFAAGDLTPCAHLLGPRVLPRFQQAIAARKQAGQTMECKIIRIRDAETASVRIDTTSSTITVRFISEQQNVLRDAGGKVIGGAEGKVEEITDLWSFSRDTAVAGSSWLLTETKS